MNETLYSWTFKFHKVVRQQNSGVVKDFIYLYLSYLFRSLSTNPKVKELLKPVHICQSYCKNKSGTFLWPTVYVCMLVRVFVYRRSGIVRSCKMGNTHDTEIARIEADFIKTKYRSQGDYRWGYTGDRGIHSANWLRKITRISTLTIFYSIMLYDCSFLPVLFRRGIRCLWLVTLPTEIRQCSPGIRQILFSHGSRIVGLNLAVF